jgi:predicted transcriptional regulator
MNIEPDISVFRSDRPGIRKVLGALEADIMEFVWELPPGRPIAVREVFEYLYRSRRIAYTTVMSTMSRLARKGLLRVEKANQAYLYYPKLSQEEFVSGFVRRILEDLLVSFSGATLDGLNSLKDPEVARRVRQLLEEISRRRAREESQ